MNISKHLSLKEVVRSNTAIKKGIDNNPTKEHLNNLIRLADNVFEPLREYINKPINVSSGYRSEALNKLIGGASGSQHSKGEALDLDNGKLLNKIMFEYIKDNLEFDQLINEQNYSWIHVSYREGKNRKQVLKMINGKYYNYE